MRVVAGELGGRRLQAPPDDRARPTSDRVREAMFNSLASRRDLTGLRVLDLFAGTGALGIEACSRGAAHATYVEQDRRMAGVLRANLEALDLVPVSEVHVAEAGRWLSGLHGSSAFDLALLDPPYAFDGWVALLSDLPAPLALVESDRPPELPRGWGVVRQKRYGGTLVTIVEQEQSKGVGVT